MSVPGLALGPGAVLSVAGGPPAVIAAAGCVVALVPAGARWLRVAQREHYLADATSRFALRWWRSGPWNPALGALGVAGLVLAAWWPLCALATAVVAVVGPIGLSVRGRTSKLVATRRLRVLAAVWVLLEAAVVVLGVVLGAPAVLAAAALVLCPALLDGACALTAPFERRLTGRFVATAADRLGRVAPTVVAVTGSYGKTSTKNHIAHLVAGTRRVVATPASFNNRAGLARAINEQLSDGTEVFVAEMGTYAKGEIAELCRWCPPEIAVITAIGPVHLERFGTEEAIAEAKAEITENASVVVLNTDDPHLGALAERLGGSNATPTATTTPAPTVVRCSSTDERADVAVTRVGERVALIVDGVPVGDPLPLGPGFQPSNLACAVAVALRLGVGPELVRARLADLPAVANRLAGGTAASGVEVLDDTFNSNPAGAAAALAALARAGAAPGAGGRRVVVTPGMVELGRRQAAENRAFAARAAEVATDLVVVGRTNRRALLAGGAPLHPVTVGTREEAVAWVRSQLGPGDVVLYENDLPDHYP